MNYIVDTNVLLDYPQILQERQHNLIILTDVLMELDGLKKNLNPDIAFKARRAAVIIARNLDFLYFNFQYEQEKIPVDDKLLKVTSDHKDDDAVLVTNDIYLKVKANIKNLPTCGYGGSEDYGGITYLNLVLDETGYNEQLDLIMQNHYYSGLHENEYLIISNAETKELLTIFRNKNNRLEEVVPKEIRNKWISKIYPKNKEQRCLFNSLQDKTNTIIYAGGTWGTGKSFILNNYAISELEKGNISKIVYVPNNAFTENTIELGALPGELLEKTIGQIGPLIDLVGIDQIKAWMDSEQLEVVPMGYIRGRSFSNAIIIVNEAQNLTEDHIKLLLGRTGENSRIFFDGDLKQADSAIFRNKNGLKLLLQLKDSPIYAPLFSVVKLKHIERSKTAQASSYLDEITGNI